MLRRAVRGILPSNFLPWEVFATFAVKDFLLAAGNKVFNRKVRKGFRKDFRKLGEVGMAGNLDRSLRQC